MKHIRILAAIVVSATLLPVCSQAAVYLNETFEDDTIGVVPGDLAQRQATQILTAAGTGLIGLDNVARHNDTSTTASGALEYNVGGSALSTMYIQFDLLNNAPVTTGSANNNLTFGVGAWNNTAASTFLGGTANRSFGVDFFQSVPWTPGLSMSTLPSIESEDPSSLPSPRVHEPSVGIVNVAL
jgi:hypothetical protein